MESWDAHRAQAKAVLGLAVKGKKRMSFKVVEGRNRHGEFGPLRLDRTDLVLLLGASLSMIVDGSVEGPA